MLLCFKQGVRKLQPSIFFIQETKLKRQGKLKMENFVIYELNRKNKNGGGLAIGVLKGLSPVWISEGGDNAEVLVVVDISGFKIREVMDHRRKKRLKRRNLSGINYL